MIDDMINWSRFGENPDPDLLRDTIGFRRPVALEFEMAGQT